MAATTDPSYRWGGDPKGLQVGVRIVPTQVRPGDSIDVRVAVHNGSPDAVTVESRFALFVQRGDTLDEHVGGPRSSEPFAVPAGAVLEIVAYQLDGEQLGATAGQRALWAVYRPSAGPELRSGHARLEVLP